MSITDLRGTIPLPSQYGIPAQRAWASIQGVTLHQTGCEMGEDLAHWNGLNAHIGVTQAGQIYILQPFDRWIWHAQGLSPHTIGIEFEACDKGIPSWPSDDPDTGAKWFFGSDASGKCRPARPITDAQIAAASELFAFLRGEFEEQNQPWSGVWTHRQSCNQRPCDIGFRGWQKIAMPWRDALACDPGQIEQVFGCGGMPIPREWDPAAKTGFGGK